MTTVPTLPSRGTPLRERPVARSAALPRPRRVHCQVTDPDGHEWPGLAVSWRQDPSSGSWSAWTVYVVTEGPDPVLVQAWTPAESLKAI